MWYDFGLQIFPDILHLHLWFSKFSLSLTRGRRLLSRTMQVSFVGFYVFALCFSHLLFTFFLSQNHISSFHGQMKDKRTRKNCVSVKNAAKNLHLCAASLFSVCTQKKKVSSQTYTANNLHLCAVNLFSDIQ